jgi:hypothetical protein
MLTDSSGFHTYCIVCLVNIIHHKSISQSRIGYYLDHCYHTLTNFAITFGVYHMRFHPNINFSNDNKNENHNKGRTI